MCNVHVFRFKIDEGQAASLDVMLEDSRGRCTGTLLHPPSMEAGPRQSQVLQRPPRPRLRSLCHRLLPLRPGQSLLLRPRGRRPLFCSVQSSRGSQFESPSDLQVGRVRIRDIAAGASDREGPIAAPISGAGRNGGVAEVGEGRGMWCCWGRQQDGNVAGGWHGL